MVKAIKLVFIYIGYQLLASALMTALSLLCPIGMGTQLGWALLLSGMAMIAHLAVFGHIDLRQALRPVGMKVLLAGIFCVAGSMLSFNALSGLIGLPDVLEAEFTALSRTVTGVVSIALVAPIVEELLFRGAVMHHLQAQGLQTKWTILLSAFMFGVIHVNPAQMLFGFLMGIVFGWIAWRTGSLIPVLAGHVLNNTVGVAELMVSSSRNVPPTDWEELPVQSLLLMIAAGLSVALAAGRMLHRLT